MVSQRLQVALIWTATIVTGLFAWFYTGKHYDPSLAEYTAIPTLRRVGGAFAIGMGVWFGIAVCVFVAVEIAGRVRPKVSRSDKTR